MRVPEPLICRSDEAGKVVLDVLNVIELGCKRIVDIDDDDFPVGLALIKERHDSEHLDLLHLPDIADLLTNLTHIEGIVVALRLGLRVCGLRVLPSL